MTVRRIDETISSLEKNPLSFVDAFGHWKLDVGDGCFEVEYRGQHYVAAFGVVFGLVWLLVLWVVPDIPSNIRVLFSFGGLCATAVIVAISEDAERREKRLGSYMKCDGSVLSLRRERHVVLSHIDACEVEFRTEDAYEGESQIAYLVVRTKDGRTLDVLRSQHYEDVQSLATTVNSLLNTHWSLRRPK